MEPVKPTYSAILSRDKQEHTSRKHADVHVNDRAHRPRSALIDNMTITGNSYSIFTTNYGDKEMHWFWMVLIYALLLFAWWKLRRYCKCPGPSKQERKDKRQEKWNSRQLEEIKEKINRYERKLEDIRSLRNSLGLEPGANSSALAYCTTSPTGTRETVQRDSRQNGTLSIHKHGCLRLG